MCCHTDDKHEHAHEHNGKPHVNEHIHDAEHKQNMLNPLNLTSEIDQKIYLVNLSIY